MDNYKPKKFRKTQAGHPISAYEETVKREADSIEHALLTSLVFLSWDMEKPTAEAEERFIRYAKDLYNNHRKRRTEAIKAELATLTGADA